MKTNIQTGGRKCLSTVGHTSMVALKASRTVEIEEWDIESRRLISEGKLQEMMFMVFTSH